MLALMSTGCPGPADLENPQVYCKPGESIQAGTGPDAPVIGCKSGGSDAGGSGATGGSAAGGTGSGSIADCEVACVKDIFTAIATCGACHSTAAKLGNLDLAMTPSANMKDVVANHMSMGAGCPPGVKLIDSANPSASWLLTKLKNGQGDCGTIMPQSGALDATKMACMETYVTCVAGAK
jgi:hypothetical protein